MVDTKSMESQATSPLHELLALRNYWLWLLTAQMILLPSFMSSLALVLGGTYSRRRDFRRTRGLVDLPLQSACCRFYVSLSAFSWIRLPRWSGMNIWYLRRECPATRPRC